MNRRRVGGAGSNPFFSPPPTIIFSGSSHTHSSSSQSSFAAIEAQRHRAELEAERIRLEAERVRAQAQLNEERRRLEEEHRREEQARLRAAENQRQLEWERGAPERAARRRQEELERQRREAIQQEIEASLAAERRLLAEKQAEEARIQQAKDMAALKINEEQTEAHRLSVYDAHRDLIAKASELEFLELQQQIAALNPLTNPIPRFQETVKKGVPLAADGKTTLFFSILNNKKFGNEAKYQLLNLLIVSKGYREHLHLLLSSPIVELLIADAQPKLLTPNEQGVIVLPDPFIILKAVFKHAVATKMQIGEAVEQLIYPALIVAGSGMDIFNYHYEQRTAEQTMKFLRFWRNFVDFYNPGSHSDFTLMSGHKDMKEDFYQLLKKEFLQLSGNKYEAFAPLVIAAGMTKDRISALLDEWCPLVNGYDVEAFTNAYETMLTLPKKEDCLGLKDTYITKILAVNEEMGKQLYERLKANKVSPAALMWVLKCWVGAFKPPHDFSVVKNLYLELSKDSPTMISQEDKVLEGLVKADKSYGLEIFKYLIENNVSKTKLMSYMDLWMDVLPNDEAIREVYQQVKPLIKKSSLNDFRFPIRTIAEMNTVKLVPEKRTIIDEEATQKFLRVTRPGFFGISCSNAHSSDRAYKEVRENVQRGKRTFQLEREQAEREINHQLKAAGEEGGFTFRP